MAGEQIINKHKLFSTIPHQINDKGDDSEDLILSAISERTDSALALINSYDLSILNTLRQSSNNRSLLHICIGIGWYKAVVQLLKRSIDVNIVDAEQQTPLMLSLNHSKTDIFKRLVECDSVNINYQTNPDGFTVLHLVMMNDLDQYLKLLLQQTKHQLDLNLITNSNKHFLHLMADFKSKKCLNIIKKFSFNDYLWKQKDNQGYTPLFIALIRWPYSSFTRHLLVLLLNLSSTSLFIQDNHGKTILHWAIFNHHLVKLIIDNQSFVLYNIKDKFGKIPLDYAYEQQLFKSVEYLRC
jgi:ankyrin repeat protein